MTAKALLDRMPNATDVQLRQAMSTVLCRCGAHVRMFAAIKKYQQQRQERRTA
jgi:nicotinate dehydrogenase subunit A